MNCSSGSFIGCVTSMLVAIILIVGIFIIIEYVLILLFARYNAKLDRKIEEENKKSRIYQSELDRVSRLVNKNKINTTKN